MQPARATSIPGPHLGHGVKQGKPPHHYKLLECSGSKNSRTRVIAVSHRLSAITRLLFSPLDDPVLEYQAGKLGSFSCQ